MPGSSTYRPIGSDIAVTISTPAMKRVDHKNIHKFIELLGLLMEELGCDGAYVSKSGAGLSVAMWSKASRGFHVKLPR